MEVLAKNVELSLLINNNKMIQEKILDYLVQKNMFFCTTAHGQIISVQDCLTAKLGRQVEFDEAVSYMKKKRFFYKMCNRCKR